MTDKFQPLNLPPVNLRTREERRENGERVERGERGESKVFDPLRGKWVTLTPEEYVRQHFVAWLQTEFGYPASLIANEIGIEVNGMRKRCDTVVFTRQGEPWIIVEYKAPDIKITQTVFDQIARYNMTLRASYLIVSNGMNHYCCKIDYEHGTYHFIPCIPDYASTFDAGVN